MHYWSNGGSAPWGMWVVMFVMMMVFVVAVAWIVVTLIRLGAGTRHENSAGSVAGAPSSAAAILDERFARGEIDIEEYTERSTALRRSASSS